MKRKERKSPDASSVRQLAEGEWNFGKDKNGKDRVTDSELVACCYWEYARESAFIREVVQDMKDVDQGRGSRRQLVAANRDLTKLYSIGTAVELFRKLAFPKPWQLLTRIQREAGNDFIPNIPTPWEMPPFQIGSSHDIAGELYRIARQRFDARREKEELRLTELSDDDFGRFDESVDSKNELAEPATQPPPLLVRGSGGVDSFIGQINWRDFDDKEIIECFTQWVKTRGTRPVQVKQHPKGVRGLRAGRGHDPHNWRASLERLGIMRLMNCQSFEGLTEIVQAAVGFELADREKYTVKASCKKEREKALVDFHELFQFVPIEDKPRSWEPQPGCW